MAHTTSFDSVRHEQGASDRHSFSLIFVLGFVVFLAIALLGQLMGLHWRTWLPGAEGMKSVFGGVKAAVYTFMSHIY
jgi:light-harvesting complex 1 beta chain